MTYVANTKKILKFRIDLKFDFDETSKLKDCRNQGVFFIKLECRELARSTFAVIGAKITIFKSLKLLLSPTVAAAAEYAHNNQ